MSIFETVYDELNVSAITSLVDDISPYVRARETGFPAITIEVPSASFERDSLGTYRTLSEVEATIMARSVAEAESVADAVLTVVGSDACNYLDSISRDYDEGYDGDSVGIFMVTINYTKQTGG